MRTLSLLLLLAGSLPAAELRFDNQTFVAQQGGIVHVPLQVSAMAPEGITALECSMDLPPNWVIDGVTTAGHLAESWGATLSHSASGRHMELALAGEAVLVGEGVLLEVRARIDGSGWTALEATANEGDPALEVSAGYLTHTLPPVLSVSPSAAVELLVGESQDYNAGGGVTPYAWSVDPPALGSITGEGLFTAAQAGEGQILVSDPEGAAGASGPLRVRSFAMGFGSADSIAGATVRLPLLLENPLGEEVTGFEIELDVNAERLHNPVIREEGMLCADWSLLVVTLQNGRLRLAGAHSEGITESGALLELEVSSTVGNGFNMDLRAEELHVNENPAVIARPGTQHFSPSGNFSISPGTALLERGESLAFQISGTPAGEVAWQSSAPLVAEVDANGLLTALQGGEVVLSATDELGQTVESGQIRVVDLDAWLPDTSAVIGEEWLWPLRCDALPSEELQSLEITLTWSSPWIQFVGIESEGCLTQDWADWALSDTLQEVRIAGAGAALALSGADLCRLRFALSPEATTQPLPVQLELLFNEGFPVVRAEGGSVSGGVQALDDAVEALAFELLPAWPNPFNPATMVEFRLARSASTRLEVYDLRGALVRRLLEQELPAGLHRVRWNGRNTAGGEAASGSYILHLVAGTGSQSRQVTLLR